MSKLDELEKLLSKHHRTRGNDPELYEQLDKALWNAAPALIAVVRAAKAWADESRYDIGHDKLNLTWLFQALAELDEVKL